MGEEIEFGATMEETLERSLSLVKDTLGDLCCKVNGIWNVDRDKRLELVAKNSSSESEFSTPALTEDFKSLLRPVLNIKEFLVTDDIDDAELNEE